MSNPSSSPVMLFGKPATRTIVPFTLAVSVLFIAFPEIDFNIARSLHTGGNGFQLRDGPVHHFVDTFVRPYVKDLVIIMLALAGINLLARGRFLKWRPKAILFMILAYAMGPGLLVNGVLKTYVGRARPKHIEALGGDKLFTGAFIPADQCASNCSFVSGDVAFVAAGLGFALLLEGPRRLIAVGACLAVTALTGYYRMAVGAHFLSDVVLAALFCFIITLSLHQALFFQPDNARN